MFTIKTNINQFGTFADFAKAYSLSEKDLVITQSFLYEPFMKDLNLPCIFIMQDKYGAGEPSDEMMDSILGDVKGLNFNRVVGIGGGTVIDIAKIFALKGVENATEAFERKIPIVKDKELVIVPTTCGTGSEVTNISIAEIKSRHTKMGLADNALLADHAVLVPELLRGLPFKFYTFSAIDALIHAMESFLSPKANAYTKLFSGKAIEIILKVFSGIAENGEEYRFGHFEEMLVASNFAGIAFGNAGVGAVHALSYPLSGKYHVAHGEANYQFLTAVFEEYLQKNPKGSICELNSLLASGLKMNEAWRKDTPSAVYQQLDGLLGKLTPRNRLSQYGMEGEDIEGFTECVMQTQQRLLANNYVRLDTDEIRNIYKSLF